MRVKTFDSMLENDQYCCYYSPDIGHYFYDELRMFPLDVVNYKKEKFVVFNHTGVGPYVKVLRLKKGEE